MTWRQWWRNLLFLIGPRRPYPIAVREMREGECETCRRTHR